MSEITISVHNGNYSKVAIQHNKRVGEYAKKPHIDPDGKNKIWEDINLHDFYEKTFGDAVKKFNQKQVDNKHPERQINNYYDYIKNLNAESKPQLCYELVVQVGSTKNPISNEQNYNEFECYNILQEYYLTFKSRNPNLKVVGCYYHADEQGQPHIHLDYVPVAGTSKYYKKGLEIQNSLTRALQEQGFSHQKGTTEQILFQEQERDALTKICAEHNLTVVHPEKDSLSYEMNKKLKHLDPEQFKAVIGILQDYKDLFKNEQQKTKDEYKAKYNQLLDRVDSMEESVSKAQKHIFDELKREINKGIEELDKDVILPEDTQFLDDGIER